MMVAAGSLLTNLVILLSSIELSSQATLEDLFPGFDGMHLPPPIAGQDPEFPEYADKIRRFNVINAPITIDPCTLIVKRDNVIIGVKLHNDIIHPVTSPAGVFNNVYVPGRGFVQLQDYEIFRLGVNQRLSYVADFERNASPELRLLRIDQRGYIRGSGQIETNHDERVQAAYQRYSQVLQTGHGNDEKNLDGLWKAYQEIYGEVYATACQRANARLGRFRKMQRKYGGL